MLTARRAITHDIDEFRFQLDSAQSFEPGQYALAWYQLSRSGLATKGSSMVRG